jgi:Coenzyme PQQ synthesis protein D (PqqD).
MYPVINKMFVAEKIQPDSSTFYTTNGSTKLPVFLNSTAADIFRLCNGINSVSEIAQNLSEQYQENYNDILRMVLEFIETAISYKHIDSYEFPQLSPICLKKYGSCEYWTPDFVSIIITNKCHLKCKHCYIDAGNGVDMEISLF